MNYIKQLSKVMILSQIKNQKYPIKTKLKLRIKQYLFYPFYKFFVQIFNSYKFSITSQ